MTKKISGWDIHNAAVLGALGSLVLLALVLNLILTVGEQRAGRACNDRGGEYVDTTNGYVCVEVRRL